MRAASPFLGVLVPFAVVSAVAPITRLTDPKARCLDGTLSAFYLEPAADAANKTKFVIYLEGGGECGSAASCAAATTGVLGSSKFFPDTKGFEEAVFYASALPSNPHFSGWNRVYVPYCSQDLHSGTRTVTSPDTFDFYFSGHLVFEAVLDALSANYGFSSSSEVILTGGSAGGIGAWINANTVVQRVPSTARVVVAPVAGMYFFAYPYTGVNHTASELVDFRESAWPFNVKLWGSYLDPGCSAALGARSYACMLSNSSLPFIKAESFVVEAQTDSVQLEAHDWLPPADRQFAPEQAYMAAWRDNMTQALASNLDVSVTSSGAFNPACYIHTGFSTTSPLIRGISYLTAFANYYFALSPASDYKLADTCGIVCNPTC